MSVTSPAVDPPAKAHPKMPGWIRRSGWWLCCLALSISAGLASSPMAGSALASVSTSGARAVDARSAHMALIANRQFLRSLVKAAPAERAAASTYVASIAQTCPGVLDGLGPITVAVKKAGVRDVIAEGLGDLELTLTAQGRGALTTFARRAMSLPWSTLRTSSDVRRYFTAEHAFYDASPSNLCADAGALVADGGQTAPPETVQWFGNFKRLTNDAAAAGRVFGRDLGRLSGPEDVPVIASTGVLTARLQVSEQSLLESNANKLLAALGLPTPTRAQFAHFAG